ncbi:NFX1-type zinc finger-containing protein 1-like isoform X1 [Bufo bufo]|uniref:NFX1-type zinc finger-containing protein 1-like isoform X1 n=1 Tax=Bufo bufo TaxID=8384 RepID=UPI001ABEA6FF|nr:NFX1-type zinc finger-containing protein 1-like isoform X1 [Bufo bufo]
METEEDSQCEDPSNTSSGTSEHHRDQETRDNADVDNLADKLITLGSNWRRKGNLETNTHRLEKSRYYPTKGNTDECDFSNADSSHNWRTREDHHNAEKKQSDESKYDISRGDFSSNWRIRENQDTEESEQTEKPRYEFTRQYKGTRFSSQTGFNSRENQDTEESEQTEKPRYEFTRQNKGTRFSSQTGFNSRGNYENKGKKFSILKSLGIVNYDDGKKNLIMRHKTRKLDILELRKMERLEPSEIIMALAAPNSGFEQLVNEATMDPELVKKLLELLSKATECMSSRQNLIHILSHVLNSLFLKQILSSYILQCSTSQQSEEICLIVDHSLTVLTEILSIFPSSSFADVTIVKTVLESVMEQMEANGTIFSGKTKQNIATLKLFLQNLQDKKQDGTLKSDNYIYVVGKKGLVLSDDFRNVSVFPTHDDIYLKTSPHLPPNIIDGTYPDVTSYLNTHFSLLREDFIRPLRDGISQYLRGQNSNYIDDIRLYFDVSVLDSICVQSGIVYNVKFSTKHLKDIIWDNSQRLLYGSLVCLSNDNFNNMLFATVAEREISNIKKGIITLMFHEESREQLALYADDNRLFVMAETTAYFEAYQHTLEGLKEMKEYDFPLQNYIVHCETTMSPPAYLFNNLQSSFTLQVLVHHTRLDFSDKATCYEINKNKTKPLKFNVLDLNTWPSKEELEFDSSQFEAFQKSLTSELSIIQGPPGTGKTYVGMKIVHALLNNGHIWKQGHGPILIVCYTNHALDQFLEGIYKSSRCSIVRVGSRSNSKLMQAFSLTARRKSFEESSRNYHHFDWYDDLDEDWDEDFPRHSKDMLETLKEEADSTKYAILFRRKIIDSAYSKVLSEYDMKKYINDDVFLNFISSKESRNSMNNIRDDWLGLAPLYLKPCSKINKTVKEKDNNVVPENKEENIDVHKAPEIALFERQLDGDDINEELAQIRASKNKDLTSESTVHNYILEDHDNDSEWEISPEERKRLQRKMENELIQKHYMSEEEYEQMSDICNIPLYKRWEIYRLWRHKVIKGVRLEIIRLEDDYQILINRLAELRNQLDCSILKKADIIGMTTTGAAKYRKLLQVVQPRIVIVEEAAEVLEAHIITALSHSCQHLILIGDHQQLRPATTVYEVAKNFNLEVSMFERLIRMGIPYVRLNYQHRMRPEIAKLLTPHIYDKLENHESVYKYDNVKGVCQNLFFVDHNHLEDHISEGKSHQNVHEATFVKSLCLYFIHQGYSPSNITILTTYSGQLHCLQNMMAKAQFDGVRVCVVDKYQGEENEIIILSLVRSNLEGNVGFLKIPNRVCVALSRARKGLFCIGNMQMLSKVPIWKKICDALKENEQIGKELKVKCVIHPNTTTYLSTFKDFDNVPEGGCMIPCDYRLDCGHVCALRCHPYDPKHVEINCVKPCLKIPCIKGHKCKKMCFEPCGDCQELVPKKIPICGHIQDLPCSKVPVKSDCKNLCTKTFSCGHSCRSSCGIVCPTQCTTDVSITLICGHIFDIACFLKSSIFVKIQCSEDNLYVGPCNICLGIRIEKTLYARLLSKTETHCLHDTSRYCTYEGSSIFKRIICDLHKEEKTVVNQWQSELQNFVQNNEAIFAQVYNASQMIEEIKRMQKTISQMILTSEKIKLLFKIAACESKLKDLNLNASQQEVSTFTCNDYKNYQIIKEYIKLKNLEEAARINELEDDTDVISRLINERNILSMSILRSSWYH